MYRMRGCSRLRVALKKKGSSTSLPRRVDLPSLTSKLLHVLAMTGGGGGLVLAEVSLAKEAPPSPGCGNQDL